MLNPDTIALQTTEAYDTERSLGLIHSLNRALQRNVATSDLVVPMSDVSTGRDLLKGTKAAEVIDAFLGMLPMHSIPEPTNSTPDKIQGAARDTDRVRGYLKAKKVSGSRYAARI